MNKKDLRNIYLQKRRALLPDQLEALNLGIIEKFREISLSNLQVIHIFYPIPGKQEFNSLLLKEHVKNTRPDIQFVLPKVNIENHTLTNILWEKETPLAMNQWGITEPEHGSEIPAEKIDMVLVPLLAFDRQGNRLGYGKGFYDKFLADCRPDVIKAGISYFAPEDRFEQVDEFDIPLDICVTPNYVWKFRRE